ncbi:hypothetical protein BASA62_006965 [Batrachochytrium salamandrivorans]|nr:hypothetical protein BASA62_006965 [Batrachochytrium salamandrivorans]
MQFTTVFIASITAIVTVNAAVLPVVNDNAEHPMSWSPDHTMHLQMTLTSKSAPLNTAAMAINNRTGGNQGWGQGGNQQWNQGGGKPTVGPTAEPRRKSGVVPRAEPRQNQQWGPWSGSGQSPIPIEDAIKQLIFIGKS